MRQRNWQNIKLAAHPSFTSTEVRAYERLVCSELEWEKSQKKRSRLGNY